MMGERDCLFKHTGVFGSFGRITDPKWLPVGATFWHRSSVDSQVVFVLVGWFEELFKNLNYRVRRRKSCEDDGGA
jgi:hypothetical protein